MSQAPHHPPTYKDIKRLTGLSLATISKYFNGRNVLDANRAAIEQAAEELGYRVNAFASGLRRGVSRTVGVVLPSLQNSFHQSVVVELEKRLRPDGTGVVVTSNEGATAPSGQEAVDLLLSRRVDGIVTVPGPMDEGALRSARALGVPLVTVDWWLPSLEVDSVSLDNVAAGRLAARHLSGHGHIDVAILAGPSGTSALVERLQGFETAVNSEGRPLAPDLVVRSPLTVRDGHAGMSQLLMLDQRPTAVFAANYELTVGALIAINESGLRLGEDISLIGFDSLDLAQVTRPKLTIIAQPVDEIAAEVARLIKARISDPAGASGSPSIVRLPGTLVMGGSVRSLHA